MSAAQPPLCLRTVLEQHGAFVCRCLRRLGVSDADLDDMLQEVFMVVYQRLGEYEERGRGRSWLYSICTRVAYAHRRKLGRRREQITAEPPESTLLPNQLVKIEQREALALGQRLLAELPEEEREIFVLYEVEGMPMAEIAEARGCPLQTAYSRLYQARRKVLAKVSAEKQGGSR